MPGAPCQSVSRPQDVSVRIHVALQARLTSFFGRTLPFDRHDWHVDRCGKHVRISSAPKFRTGSCRACTDVLFQGILLTSRLRGGLLRTYLSPSPAPECRQCPMQVLSMWGPLQYSGRASESNTCRVHSHRCASRRVLTAKCFKFCFASL